MLQKRYSARLFVRATHKTKEYLTVEIFASSVAGLVVGGLTSGFSWSSAGIGVLTFLVFMLIGFLIHLALAPHGLDAESQQEIATLQNTFKELTEYKLSFEIDERTTRVYLYEPKSTLESLALAAKIKLRFENKDTHPISMKRLDVKLCRLVPEQEAKEIYTTITLMYTSNGKQIKEEDFEGMMIQDRRLTPFYSVEAVMVIDDEEVKSASDLDGLCFLRLTMEAGGYQPLFSADLFLSWKDALKETGTDLTMTFNAPAIRPDNRRL